MSQRMLTAKSYLAPNMLWLYRAMCDALERETSFSIMLSQSTLDALDDAALGTGEVDLAFICGLPLVRLMRDQLTSLQPLSAAVFTDPRGGGRAVYFADVIVRADSPFQTLADLEGSTFCYNDPGSNSGHHLLRYHMVTSGYKNHFFGKSIQSGAHQRSIERVMSGEADCAAIDNTVLAQAVRDNPDLSNQFRIVDSTAACPVPPLAFFEREPGLQAAFRDILDEPDAALKSAMQEAGVTRFEIVSPDDYAIVGEMFDAAIAADYHIIR